MLDLTKLALQMQGISNHLAQEAAASRTRLERAQHLVTQAAQHQAILVQMGQEWRDRLSFTAAEPMEPMETKVAIATPPAQHTVLATDGSQIAPSHHEIAYCYLINIGRVVLHYGQNRQPLLDSLPEVFYQSDDLYGARKWGIGTEEWMGYRRTVTEVEMLAELAAGIASSPPQASLATLASTLAPTLALVDGSLIYWFWMDCRGRRAIASCPRFSKPGSSCRRCGCHLLAMSAPHAAPSRSIFCACNLAPTTSQIVQPTAKAEVMAHPVRFLRRCEM